MTIEYGKDNKKFRIIDSLELTESSREVQYSDITIDFENGKIEDLPFYLQEMRIRDDKGNLIYTGYLNEYTLPELRIGDISRQVSISLFTPRELSTKRTVTICRTDKLTEIIKQTLSPLFEDGFKIQEMNIEDKVVTVKIISRTVEEIMNYFSNKYSLYWNIDYNKRIIINSIDYQLNKPNKLSINSNDYKEKLNGLISITPTVQSSNYSNIINVKNARIFYTDQKENLNIKLSENDRIDFENPIDISLATAERLKKTPIKNGSATSVTNLNIVYNTNKVASIICNFNVSQDIGNGRKMIDIGTDDAEGPLFSLTMDSTFKNLATSLTYKGTTDIVINSIYSETALRYANMKLINWKEINKSIGNITPSGQIEGILDVEQGWFTEDELIEYIKNTFVNNSKEVKIINIKTDEYNNLQIGDKVEIDIIECLTSGQFILTDKIETHEGTYTNYEYELRNTSLQENFIDLFRSSLDIEEEEEQTSIEYVVEYVEEETIKEIHEIEEDRNENQK